MLTVVLSTVDRAATLARTLQALCELQEPAGGWQLLVVDNGSVDETPQVLASFADRLPLRVFRCAERGKNRALNSVVAHFRGDLVVFTDDDVIPAPDWLIQHRTLADLHPEITFFCGPILPAMKSPPPAWIKGAIPFDVCFAQTGQDWEEGVCAPDQIWGGNMSVRVDVFEGGCRFDPGWGPRANSSRYLTGGETSFVKRLHEQGRLCWFSRAPVVQHLIRDEQQTYEWIMQRGFRFGRLRAAQRTRSLQTRGRAWLRWLRLEGQCALNSLRWTNTSAEAWRARRDWQLNVQRGESYHLAVAREDPRFVSAPAMATSRSRWPEPLLRIPLNPPMGPEVRAYYSGRRSRIATVTAVRFIDEHQLLATHLSGHRMYLIEFDAERGTYEVLDEIPTTWQGKETVTELLDINAQGLIAVSNFDAHGATLYRIEGRRLRFERDIPVPLEDPGECHGVKFVPGGRVLCLANRPWVFFIQLETGALLYQFRMEGWNPKDVCFIDDTKMVVIWTQKNPSAKSKAPCASKASLIALDLECSSHQLICEVVMSACQADSCVYHDGRIFMTDQMDDCLRVLITDGTNLSFEKAIGGYSFPHGIDVLPQANLLAVTNYGTSDVVLMRLDEALAAGRSDQIPLLAVNREGLTQSSGADF